MINPFFENKGPFKIEDLLRLSTITNKENFKKTKVFDIKDLVSSSKKDITFFHSKKYEALASKTKASFCLTTNNLAHILPKTCQKIIVDNVLISTSKITQNFYPNSVTDDFDINVKDINKSSLKKS